ncbi:hypothetical protein [Mycobacteroides abscessus]|uniref:hypothetical protein n=1 Tax=Mycobacteroides abscessus TaxID=36809 RepID=UPI003AF62F09
MKDRNEGAKLVDMSAWESVELDILTEIHLDPKNVRLEDATDQIEADIIADLFANEDVLSLVDGIAKIGLLTHEVPIVVKRRRKYIVVEGNRRIAALKAIQNPHLVPAYQARIKAITQTIVDKAALARITVKVAPNQEEANQVIAAIHTGNIRKGWQPARQSAFFQAQIDNGRTLAQLEHRYPTIKNIRRYVFRGLVANRFKDVDYSKPELKDFILTKDWKKGLSTLARIFESKDFLTLTGLKLNNDGTLESSIDEAQFSLIAETIVEGMSDGSINTRSINTVTSPRFLKLISDLRGSIGISDPPAASDSEVAKPKNVSRPRVPSKPKRAYLDLGDVVVPDSFGKPLQKHYEEATVLNVRQTPNVAFIFSRAILEKTVKAYASNVHGVEIGKTKHNTNGYVYLSNALRWLLEHFEQEGPRALVQPTKRLLTGRLVNYTSSGDAMNAANHNHEFNVDPDESFEMWDSLDALLRHMLKEKK